MEREKLTKKLVKHREKADFYTAQAMLADLDRVTGEGLSFDVDSLVSDMCYAAGSDMYEHLFTIIANVVVREVDDASGDGE